MPEETDSDIREGIDNLKYMRFYLNINLFRHSHSALAIAHSSKYYREIVDRSQLELWSASATESFLPKGFIRNEDKYNLLLDFMKQGYNLKWNVFSQIEQHYINNEYSYMLYQHDAIILYRERYNGMIVNELEFEVKGVHWQILCLCNQVIHSIEDLSLALEFDKQDIIYAINELASEGLIYTNHSSTEIVSIIDTNLLK